MIAAVAESAPTTRWREEPSSAKIAIGINIVYRPVTTGMPAIRAYPITSGMPSAASVRPATTSGVSPPGPSGSTPWRTGRPSTRLPAG
jgi:hypothetical protein